MTVIPAASIEPKHFAWSIDGKVATIMINRPERKNPLTFESYAELRDTFRTLQHVDDIKTIVITGEGGNFCSGGDVHEIIGPLLDMDMKELLRRRYSRHGLRPALRHGGIEDRVPVHPRRPRRLRYGGLLDPAPNYRSGPGV